jgi:superfamily II DNA or RNA helicase
MIMCDEVHCCRANVLSDLMTNVLHNVPIRWGITGTIPKEDFEFHSLLISIGPVINRIKAKDLQEKGVLSDCHVHITQLVDYGEYRDYSSEMKYLVCDVDRIKYLANKILEISETGNTLVLFNYIKTGSILKEELPNSKFIHGSVKVSDRSDVFHEINFDNNRIMLATYGTCSVGINITRLFNVVLIEPGKSFIRVIQSIGRGLRKTNDKDFVNIYDFTSTLKYSKRHLTERKRWYKEAQYPFDVTKDQWQG